MHDHSQHGHVHAPASYGRAFAIGISLNIVFVIVEAAFGFWTNSLALLADAGHNLSDVLGLILAWGAVLLGRKAPSARFTYGLRSSSILAALANAVLLLLATGGIVVEAIGRFGEDNVVEGGVVIGVALVGVAINTLTALMFMSGSRGI